MNSSSLDRRNSPDCGSLRVIFAGTPDFAVPTLQALLDSPHQVVSVYTQPDRPAGRGRKLQASPVKQCAEKQGIPIAQPLHLKTPEAQQQLAELAPDVMVVVAYGLLLPPAVLAIPALGCINVHASLLPRWRGAAPIQRCIEAGDAETGVSLMLMDAGLDTGGVLCRHVVPIAAEATAASLHDELAALGGTTLIPAMVQWCDGSLQPTPQDDGLATYAAKLHKHQAELDWALPALELHRRIMAFNPWPVAQTWLGEQRLRIWRSGVSEQTEATAAPPGSVIGFANDGIDIATGAGVLRLLELQLPGRKPMAARDLLNSNTVRESFSDRVLGAAGTAGSVKPDD